MKRVGWVVVSIAHVLYLGCATTTEVSRGDRAEVREEQEKQMVLFLNTWLDRQGRMHDLSYPIFVANADLCGSRVQPLLGFSWVTRDDLGFGMDDYRAVLTGTFGIADQPTIINITDSGPASIAGLQRWDVLKTLDGMRVPKDRWYSNTRDEFKELVRKVAGDGQINVVFTRDGATYETSIKTVQACRSSVYLIEDNSINAFADGKDIYVRLRLSVWVMY